MPMCHERCVFLWKIKDAFKHLGESLYTYAIPQILTKL